MRSVVEPFARACPTSRPIQHRADETDVLRRYCGMHCWMRGKCIDSCGAGPRCRSPSLWWAQRGVATSLPVAPTRVGDFGQCRDSRFDLTDRPAAAPPCRECVRARVRRGVHGSAALGRELDARNRPGGSSRCDGDSLPLRLQPQLGEHLARARGGITEVISRGSASHGSTTGRRAPLPEAPERAFRF